MGQRSDAAFVAVNFVSRWLYTRDKAFLTDSFQTESLGWAREKVTPYDLLKDVAAFWMCYLEVGTHLSWQELSEEDMRGLVELYLSAFGAGATDADVYFVQAV